MKKQFALGVLILAGAVSSAMAQWRQNGQLVPDEPWRKSQGKFGVMMLLTDTPQKFLADWDKPTAGVPIQTTSVAHRGSKVVAFLIFINCTGDDAGLCNATVNFRVLKPDGTEYAAYKDRELWKNRPAGPSDHVQLGVDYLEIGVEPTDPLGEYRILANVRDQNSRKVIGLEQHLKVEQK